MRPCLFQASGHTSALRKLIVDEQDRGPDFLRLANALSALYPRSSEEKRLLRRNAIGSTEVTHEGSHSQSAGVEALPQLC